MKPVAGSTSRALVCHPQTPARAIHGIEVLAAGVPGRCLSLVFVLEGDLSALCIPGPQPVRRAHHLWQHTCFEVFVMAEGGPGYREFNLSPSGAWATHCFHGYRDGGELEVDTGPGIMMRRTGDRLQLDAEIHSDLLPPGRSLRLGLAAVIEDNHGLLSYWALRHPAGMPDFHDADAFMLQLELP